MDERIFGRVKVSVENTDGDTLEEASALLEFDTAADVFENVRDTIGLLEDREEQDN